jgi:hypothetical protein
VRTTNIQGLNSMSTSDQKEKCREQASVSGFNPESGHRRWRPAFPLSQLQTLNFKPCAASRQILAAMSALGQKRTWKPVSAMSALPPKADIDRACPDVRFVLT